MEHIDIISFFIAWTSLGICYFGVKYFEDKKTYDNENNLGKALTIFLGGPGIMLLKLAFFIYVVYKSHYVVFSKNLKFFDKK